jgi:hypothetical protein
MTPISVEPIMSMATLTCSATATQPPIIAVPVSQRGARPQPLCMPPDPDGLATLSHELKTPLVALLGFVQLLEADAHQPLSEPQRRRAQEIERAGQQMLQLVTTLLGQARRGEWATASVAQ